MTVGENTIGLPQNRADQVRARRVRRSRQVERPKRVKQNRTGKRRRPRRRYDVALGVERGTEIQVRLVPSGFLGTRTVSLVLVVLCILCLVQFARSDRFIVDVPKIEGNALMSAAQVRSLAGVEGRSVFRLDPREIENRLEEVGEVKESQVRFKWPNTVLLEIEERPPMAAWNDGGRIWWLSDDGVAYIQHGENNDLIQISSEAGVLDLSSDELEAAIDPGILAGADKLQDQLPAVTNWNYDRDQGLGFVDPQGRQVYFGNGSQASQKAAIYNAIAEKLDGEQIQATVISVADHNAPYYSVE